MKALVISGGGNRGAGGAGKIARLDQDFDVGIGVSTGALMVSMALLKEYDVLKEAYTTATASDVFDRGKNPFNKKGHVRPLYVLWRMLFYKSWGETNALRRTIEKHLTEERFYKLRDLGKEAIVAVYNENEERTEYYSSKDCSYKDFIFWTWASACQPPASSVPHRNGQDHSDGVQEVFPMTKAVLMGAKSITGILHRPLKLPVNAKEKTKNFWHRMVRLQKGQRREILTNDLRVGVLAADSADVPYELHFVPYGYGENDLVFDPERMKQMWYNAFNEDLNPIHHYEVT